MKIVCDCGSENVSIMSVEEGIVKCDNKIISTADITYICNDCGKMETKSEYLYKMKYVKLKNE